MQCLNFSDSACILTESDVLDITNTEAKGAKIRSRSPSRDKSQGLSGDNDNDNDLVSLRFPKTNYYITEGGGTGE